jgi:hypothetical protein
VPIFWEKHTLKARLHTPQVIETVNLLMTDDFELDTEKNQCLNSEVVNYIEPPRHSSVVIQQGFGTNLRIAANSVLLAIMIVPVFFIPGLIIVVLPAGMYLLGKVYDDIIEKTSKKDEASETMVIERATEENEKARLMVYGAHLIR